MSAPPTRAFVWAAGLGTRLRPYTYETPKPLLPVLGRPLIEYILEYLSHVGIREVTVNTWHLGSQFEGLPARAAEMGLELELSAQPDRFEHAGDLAFARPFLARLAPDEAFLGLNGDTLFYLDPAVLAAAASRVSADAPVAVLVHKTDSNLIRTQGEELVGIGKLSYLDGAEPDGAWDDFGIKVFHASIRDYLPAEPGPFSFHGEGGLLGHLARDGKWAVVQPVGDAERVEIGTVEDYETHEDRADLRALVARLAEL
jgi:NDP-sugar pyrophosphorylase family protein